MRVLGIDPGFGRCGVAVLEREKGRDSLLYSDCIETGKDSGFPDRLSHVTNECASLMKKFAPEVVAIEKLYFSSNKKTAMQVAEVRGALINAAQNYGVRSFEYTPAQIKSATTGSGRADKRQMAKMLHALLKIEKVIKHDDEYDAMAVGITHLAHHRT